MNLDQFVNLIYFVIGLAIGLLQLYIGQRQFENQQREKMDELRKSITDIQERLAVLQELNSQRSFDVQNRLIGLAAGEKEVKRIAADEITDETSDKVRELVVSEFEKLGITDAVERTNALEKELQETLKKSANSLIDIGETNLLTGLLTLTDNQRKILYLALRNYQPKNISDILAISEDYIHRNLQEISSRFGVKDIDQLLLMYGSELIIHELGINSLGDLEMAPSATQLSDPVDPSLATRIPVLEYHDTEFKMGPTLQMKTEWFLAQMQWLSDNGFFLLSGDDLIQFVQGDSRPPQKSCVLRFDLGQPALQNYQEVIIPALEKYSFHAIFFLLTNMIKDDCVDNYLCWSQLLEWEKAGLIEFGSHGVYHPDYKKLSLAARRWDARESKRLIEAMVGHPISFFGYPYDSVPTNPSALLKPLGYRLAFAGYRPERSVLFKDPTPYALPCYYVYSGEKSYPVITGTRGLTFGQMVLKAVAPKK
jgi:peptidoglycan/xylan/chitin deacetylase (PgdA/CDA1 family)/DNA-binding CsgD family transcriptional regulator